jgi:hypothetical protein
MGQAKEAKGGRKEHEGTASARKREALKIYCVQQEGIHSTISIYTPAVTVFHPGTGALASSKPRLKLQ